MSKYRVNWRELADMNGEEIKSKIDAICDYVNTDDYPRTKTILAMLKLEEIKEDEVSLLTDNTGGYAE